VRALPDVDELTLLDIPAGCQHSTAGPRSPTSGPVISRVTRCRIARISRQQQFLRAVIAKVLQPGELLRLQQLVPELLGNLVVDEGMNPAELVYLAGLLQVSGRTTRTSEFCRRCQRASTTRAAPMCRSSGRCSRRRELLRRIRCAARRPRSELQTPSPANIVVSVVDRNGSSVAANVFDILTEGGFNAPPGVIEPTVVRPPTKADDPVSRGRGTDGRGRGTYFGTSISFPHHRERSRTGRTWRSSWAGATRSSAEHERTRGVPELDVVPIRVVDRREPLHGLGLVRSP
jgi:hypothetical protein